MKSIISIAKELEAIFGKDFISNIFDLYDDLGRLYLNFLQIDKHNRTHDEIAALIGTNRTRVTYWLHGNIPFSIKTIITIYEKKFHKIPKHVLARIVGWGMGGGGLDRTHYFFFCSNKEDLEKINVFLEQHTNLKFSMSRNKTVGNFTRYDGIIKNFSGDNWILRIADTSFVRFLYSLGLPKGSKVSQVFLIPKWITDGNNIIKKEFLSALFECELERFRLQFQKKKTYTKVIINAPIFGMCKVEKYVNNLNEFLNQIRAILLEILLEFGIQTSSLSIPAKSNLRKDGNISYFVRFNIRSSSENILRFSEVVDLKFNRDKRETLKIVVKEARKKIERELSLVEKYHKSQILFEDGYNFSEIAQKLGVTHSTAKEWIVTKNHLPRRLEKQIG